ncbi:MAG: PLP-dependent transferase [Fimbriimonadaceae bacterium]|nr:PLP-dependent transferase [Fimbriimonadaceae bacterium]
MTWGKETHLQHLGEEKHYAGAVTPPIFQTSLFVHDTLASLKGMIADPNVEERYVYSRVGNPNMTIVEKKLAMLEGTESAMVFASGMAAITAAVMHSVRAGDHIVCVDTSYGPTRSFMTDYLPGYGVETTYVVGHTDEIEAAIQPNTKLIYLESPSSVLFRIQDFRAITAIAKAKGIKTITDNSNCSPLFQNPAAMGVDIVVHSATKYLCGHSDVVAGALCASKAICEEIAMREGQWFGGRLAPFDSWLMLRGMRTLRLRMDEAKRMGALMFDFLKTRPEVEEIYYSGDPNHPQRELIESQQTGHNSLITFKPKVQADEALAKFAESLDIFQMGVSWGGFESLAVPIYGKPMDWPEEQWVVRLYLGLEDIEDLKADLDQGFAHLR